MAGQRSYHPRHFFRGLSVVAGFLCCGLIAGCSKPPDNPLRMGSTLWPGFEAFYIARERGLWHDDQVRLLEYASTSELIRAFRTGTIDAGLVTLDEALLLAEDVPNIRIVLVTDVSNGADVILAKPAYHSVQDLKGHRIGAETSALGAYVLYRALQSHHLTRNDVDIVPLEFSEHENAFAQGDVDAVVTYEPVRTKLLAAGAHQVFDSSEIPGEIVDVMVARGDYLASSPATVSSLVEAFYRAQLYMRESPADALRIAAARENISPQEFRQSMALLRVPSAAESAAMLGGQPSALQKNARALAVLMERQSLLLKPVDVDSLFDQDLIHRLSR